MNYEKIINEKISELRVKKDKLEKDYDELLPTFAKRGKELENHESYTRILNITVNEINKINENIRLLYEIKNKAH